MNVIADDEIKNKKTKQKENYQQKNILKGYQKKQNMLNLNRKKMKKYWPDNLVNVFSFFFYLIEWNTTTFILFISINVQSNKK